MNKPHGLHGSKKVSTLHTLSSLSWSCSIFPTLRADDIRFSLLMTSKTAKPMAHETGFPPNVEKYAPSFLETRVDVITAPRKW